MVWKTVVHVASSSPGLLIGRNLDHIVVCSIYVVCKVTNQSGITFNAIINEYVKQRKDKDVEWKEVITKVKVREGITGDIIRFYNEVFIEQVKGYVFSITGASKEEPPVQPAKRAVEEMWVPDSLAEFANKHRLVDLEARGNGAAKPRALYVFGKSASKKLEKITAMLEAESIH